MLDLPHHETELRGEWTLSEGRVIADHTCRRIEALTRLVLKRVAAHPSDGGWTILFRDPRDGRLWELTYPKSELHGGGPPLLRQISLAEAMEAYGTASLEGHVDVTSDVALAPWKKKKPDIIADVRLYQTEMGGRKEPLIREYGCSCFASMDTQEGGWDARFQLDCQPFLPGTERRIGVVFLTIKGAAAIRQAGRFYLWEGRFIGEAKVLS